MALQVYHRRAENTHENEQFRRIAKDLKLLFNKMKWDGVLIGNPENPNFNRFRADAILYYTNGLIIIDLKDYAGDIKLPPNSKEFKQTKWYIDTETDNRRIEIKGGSRFINPFKQLESYRNSFIELINSNIILSEKINHSRISIINIFSGPIKSNAETPRDIPYYRIVQESNFQNFLYDYASPNKFHVNIAEELVRIFPSDIWSEKIIYKDASAGKYTYLELTDDKFKTVIADFINQPDQQILVLESGEAKRRDEWLYFLLNNGTNYGIPQVDVWTHSTRIARRIKTRSGIEAHSLFSTIYGGVNDTQAEGEEKVINPDQKDNSTDKSLEQIQDVIGIRSDKELDTNSLVILCESHLVTRSLYQTELLRFGTGRLLEDLFTYLKLSETNRKLICIGDPYSLSYGDVDESAISIETLSSLHESNIQKYREKDDNKQESSLNNVKGQITTSIDSSIYNNLHYEWDNKSFSQIDKTQAEGLFHKWFKYACEKEPDFAVLVFKNKDALKISQWIRKNVQNKKEEYSQGDLLIANNSFNIPDETGLSYPQRIQNGMYLRIEDVLERRNETINPKKRKPVSLRFLKLKVTCLSTVPNSQADIWILENYIQNSYELTLEEQIAFRVFVSIKIEEYRKKNAYENSHYYNNLINSDDYKAAVNEQQKLKQQLESGESVKTKLDEGGVKMRKLERTARKRHRQNAMVHLLNSDPLVNAALVQFGYSMNVHKALGSSFKEIVFNVFQGENFGITNESYFRWLYTGLSCGVDTVKIINPLPINPLMECVFEDTDNVIIHDSKSKSKTQLEFPSIEVPSEVESSLNQQASENVKYGISHLINILQPNGYLFDTLIYKPYAVKVLFSTPKGKELDDKDKLYLIFHYNSKGTVTSIRIEKEGKSERRVIESCINELTKSIDLPNDWRRKFFQIWSQKFSKSGFKLNILEEHKNQTVLKISNEEKSARFRLWYLNEGFFSKVSMIEKSTTELGIQIKEILFDGYKA